MMDQLRAVEDGYMELFCEKRDAEDIIFFRNQVVSEMYDQNFILIEGIARESETIGFIRSELEALGRSDRAHLKIVFHPRINLSDRVRSTMAQLGFDISELYYMLFRGNMGGDWAKSCDCVVKKATTIDEIQCGADCAVEYAAQRMASGFAHKKVEQKKALYENGLLDLYICYKDGFPVGFCDWYEKDGIIKLEEVTILNRFQGKGLGTRMLRQLLDRAVRECNKQVYIVTETGNEHNIYLQLGFQTVGIETECFYMKQF